MKGNLLVGSKKTRVIVKAVLFTFLFFFIFAYVNFTFYKPRVTDETGKVRGAKEVREYGIPLPSKYVLISADETVYGMQSTLEVDKTPLEVQVFYKNVLLAEGWEVERELGTGSSVLSTEFKRGKDKMMIVSAGEVGGGCLVSVDLRKFE